MRSASLAAAAVLLTIQAVAAAADPAADWKGVKVMPKIGAVARVKDEVIDCRKFTLPWTVHDVNGDELLVGDERKGWVQRSQVLTVDEATAYYTKLIDTYSPGAWPYYYRAISWQLKGDIDSAIADYGEALRLSPSVSCYTSRGNAWCKKNDYDRAIADFDQAIRLDPNHPWAYYLRAITWRLKGDLDSAIADYGQALRLNPSPTEYIERGNIWSDKLEFDKAIADFDQAIRLDPNAATAYGERGFAWSKKKDYDKAIADFDRAILIDPTDPRVYTSRGNAWSSKGDYDKAIADFNQVIRLAPDFGGTYCNRGRAWSHKKEYAKAIADYDHAIRICPTLGEMYYHAAFLRATCPDDRYRDGGKAIELATKACSLASWRNGRYSCTLAAAYAEAGDFESAIKWQQKAIELNPDDAEFVRKANERLALYRDHKPYREE